VRIEQRRQPAQNAALGLPTQPQQNKIMPRQYRIHDLRNHRIVIADDAGEQTLVRAGDLAQPCDQVVAQLILHAAVHACCGVFRGAKLA
jgi:hypothetical protein